jgi:hypothetical protein
MGGHHSPGSESLHLINRCGRRRLGDADRAKKLYRASAARMPKPLTPTSSWLKASNRYDTACTAALAAASQVENAAKPDRPKPCALRSDTPTHLLNQ